MTEKTSSRWFITDHDQGGSMPSAGVGHSGGEPADTVRMT